MMIKNESDLLKYIQKTINVKSQNVVKGIGDDCAVLKINEKQSLVITTDTSLKGPHFTDDYSPREIGYKSLATNLSDIAAMGCTPKYVLMSITIPALENSWIKSFYSGIRKLIIDYNLVLIGGDTNRGPLSISIQVIGINKNKILYRNTAKHHDDIYVTGKLGCARAALILSKERTPKKEFKIFKKFLRTPKPRIEIGEKISNIANSCIDISDGLIKDLGNIICSSKLGATINLEKIPTHHLIKKVIDSKKYHECIIGGGEDYELCFTAHNSKRKRIKNISSLVKVPITLIGRVTKKNLIFLDKGIVKKIKFKGFDHFA